MTDKNQNEIRKLIADNYSVPEDSITIISVNRKGLALYVRIRYLDDTHAIKINPDGTMRALS